jgi:hypothetical protein
MAMITNHQTLGTTDIVWMVCVLVKSSWKATLANLTLSVSAKSFDTEVLRDSALEDKRYYHGQFLIIPTVAAQTDCL